MAESATQLAALLVLDSGQEFGGVPNFEEEFAVVLDFGEREFGVVLEWEGGVGQVPEVVGVLGVVGGVVPEEVPELGQPAKPVAVAAKDFAKSSPSPPDLMLPVLLLAVVLPAPVVPAGLVLPEPTPEPAMKPQVIHITG